MQMIHWCAWKQCHISWIKKLLEKVVSVQMLQPKEPSCSFYVLLLEISFIIQVDDTLLLLPFLNTVGPDYYTICVSSFA